MSTPAHRSRPAPPGVMTSASLAVRSSASLGSRDAGSPSTPASRSTDCRDRRRRIDSAARRARVASGARWSSHGGPARRGRPDDPGAEPRHQPRPGDALSRLPVFKGELKAKRKVMRISVAAPRQGAREGAGVTILADRGSATQAARLHDELGWRCHPVRGKIHVAAADGETRLAADWVGKGGRARKIPPPRSPRAGAKWAPSSASTPKT